MKAVKVADEFRGLLEEVLTAVGDKVPIEITYWDGVTKRFGSKEPVARIRVKSPDVFRDMARQLSLGFGENYINGNIDVEGDLQQVLRIQSLPQVRKLKPSAKAVVEIALYRLTTLNSIKQAKSNIQYHYDLGNDFYRLFLDESMTYSCAYFKNWDRDTLEDAQRNKYELIVRKIRLKDGDRVVDVGCGWGGFLIYAAQRYNIKGVGCTISKNQYEYANEKIKQLGLQDRIEVIYEDYRNLKGRFNKFVSIGAYEHIGKNYAFIFFKKLNEILEDGAVGLLHTIGYNEPLETDPFTVKYIFPGGYLPSLEELIRRIRTVNFYTIDVENLRPHYARTLDNWIERFSKNIDKVRSMFDERFVRMWWLYLNGASVAFKYGDSQLYQILFSKGQIQIPPYRGEIYRDWD